MTEGQLKQLWHVVEAVRPSSDELSVHAVAILSHGSDLCIGHDSKSRHHLLVPLPPGTSSAPSFRSEGLFVRTRVLHRNGIDRTYLDLVCLSPNLNDIFSHLVLDVLQQLHPDEPLASSICLEVLESWKELFGVGGSGMGREQIVGLLGELLVLEKLTQWNASALQSWDGPLGGIHDFRSGLRSIEVKSSNRRHGRFFTISGHRQLEAPQNGELYFAAVKLEENPGGTTSIPLLIGKIRRHGVDSRVFTKRLSETGYTSGASELADNTRFDVSEFLLYAVDEHFPRVIESSFVNGNVPAGILKITYEIDLSGAIPSPLSPLAIESYLRSYAMGG